MQRASRFVTRNQGDAILAAIVNRKFVHIIRHIIPGRGWLADIEYDRVCELDAALGTNFYAAGLNKKPPLQIQAEKEEKKAEQRAIKGKKSKGGTPAEAAVDESAGEESAAAQPKQTQSGGSKKKKGKKKK
jgi:hypothetical protein